MDYSSTLLPAVENTTACGREHYCLRSRTLLPTVEHLQAWGPVRSSCPPGWLTGTIIGGDLRGQPSGADREHQLRLFFYLVNLFQAVTGTDWADVDTKEEKKSGIDTNYPVINYYDVVMDNRYLSIDIFYPKRTK